MPDGNDGADMEFPVPGGATPTWAEVLAAGNVSGGSDVIMTAGDAMIGEDNAGTADAGAVAIRGGNLTGAPATAFDGGAVTVTGGSSNSGNNGARGGDVTIAGGSLLGSSGGTSRAGDVFIKGGHANGSGAADGGNVNINGGESASDIPGNVNITGGKANGVDAGDVNISGGPTTGGGSTDDGGDVNILAGTVEGAATTYNTGNINITVPQVTTTHSVQGGDIAIQAGNTGTRNVSGGDVNISGGNSNGGGGNRAGDVTINGGNQASGTGGDGGDINLNPGTSTAANPGVVNVARGNLLMQTGKVVLSNGTAVGPGLWGGTGAPAGTLGANGDFYFRADGNPGVTASLYLKIAGTWTVLIA